MIWWIIIIISSGSLITRDSHLLVIGLGWENSIAIRYHKSRTLMRLLMQLKCGAPWRNIQIIVSFIQISFSSYVCIVGLLNLYIGETIIDKLACAVRLGSFLLRLRSVAGHRIIVKLLIQAVVEVEKKALRGIFFGSLLHRARGFCLSRW